MNGYGRKMPAVLMIWLLSLELRKKLAEEFELNAMTVDTTQHSSDGTLKSRFKTFDGHLLEGVIIPTEKRNTACVSSQIGCSLACKFCATGLMDANVTCILMRYTNKGSHIE